MPQAPVGDFGEWRAVGDLSRAYATRSGENTHVIVGAKAWRHVALLGGDRDKEAPATENKEGCLSAAPAHVHSARAAFLLLEQSLQPHPARSMDWPHGPCLASASCFLGGNS